MSSDGVHAPDVFRGDSAIASTVRTNLGSATVRALRLLVDAG
jgi:hypothetical protein